MVGLSAALNALSLAQLFTLVLLVLCHFISFYQASVIPATPATTQLKSILLCGQTECFAVFVDWSNLFHRNHAAAGLSWPRVAPWQDFGKEGKAIATLALCQKMTARSPYLGWCRQHKCMCSFSCPGTRAWTKPSRGVPAAFLFPSLSKPWIYIYIYTYIYAFACTRLTRFD